MLVGIGTPYAQNTQERCFVKSLERGDFTEHLYKGWVFMKHLEGLLEAPVQADFAMPLGLSQSPCIEWAFQISQGLNEAPTEKGL